MLFHGEGIRTLNSNLGPNTKFSEKVFSLLINNV